MIFIENPKKYAPINEAIREIGTVSAGISVVFHEPINRYSTTITRKTVIARVS